MIPWLEGAIPYLKALHIAALVIWCAGLFALPLMLARHDPALGQAAGTGLLWVLGGYLQMALLGALLTFAPEALYAIHAVAPLDWNFTPLGDQQLGGLIMWVPAGLPFAVWGGLVARRGWQAVTKGLA